MSSKNHWWLLLQTLRLVALYFIVARAHAAEDAAVLEKSFAQDVKPFLNHYCVRCHNPDKLKSGVRVDQLDAVLGDQHLRLWQQIQKQIGNGAMPPEDEVQPTDAERQRMVGWIQKGLEIARLRPTPKNGTTRRLTVSQYRNTLRELLLLEDDLTDSLPPDAVSRDGFLNNKETLHVSPLLLEAYYEIAEIALNRCLVDPSIKPTIQNFRVDLGLSINPQPFPDNLILGADSLLLGNADFVVNQLTPSKPFDFEPFFMQTKYRFIEGYEGNGTVRGWRGYDSIYHAVFACMRGSGGYPKGLAYSTVAGGLLLRPAIPSAELFGVESTYGPKANFKISLRELPDHGRFRITVMAEKYNDGLLLDPRDIPQSSEGAPAVLCRDPETPQTVMIQSPGIYQVDVHAAFDADITRSVTFMLNREDGMGISDTFPLKLGLGSTHHNLSHAGDKNGQLVFAKYDLFLSGQVAHFFKRLTGYKDRNGSVLDNTIVLFGSGASTTHNPRNLPTLIAGGSAMGLRHGLYWRSGETRMSNMHLSILRAMGIDRESFADSTTTLSDSIFSRG